MCPWYVGDSVVGSCPMAGRDAYRASRGFVLSIALADVWLRESAKVHIKTRAFDDTNDQANVSGSEAVQKAEVPTIKTGEMILARLQWAHRSLGDIRTCG